MKNKIIIIILIIIVGLIFIIPTNDKDKKDLYENKEIVKITFDGYGEVTLELYPDVAPITVKNFKDLVNSGYYNGLLMHRIVKDFVIQGGQGEEVDSIKGEFKENGVINPLSHTEGVISMARNNISMDSASSQFFIVVKDAPSLDGKYASFGKVIKGMNIVKEISLLPVNEYDEPLNDVIISKIEMIDK